jgi:hypothetical protein
VQFVSSPLAILAPILSFEWIKGSIGVPPVEELFTDDKNK